MISMRFVCISLHFYIKEKGSEGHEKKRKRTWGSACAHAQRSGSGSAAGGSGRQSLKRLNVEIENHFESKSLPKIALKVYLKALESLKTL